MLCKVTDALFRRVKSNIMKYMIKSYYFGPNLCRFESLEVEVDRLRDQTNFGNYNTDLSDDLKHSGADN